MINLDPIKQFANTNGFKMMCSGNLGDYNLWVYEYIEIPDLYIKVRAQVYITENYIGRVKTELTVDKKYTADNTACINTIENAIELAQMFRNLEGEY